MRTDSHATATGTNSFIKRQYSNKFLKSLSLSMMLTNFFTRKRLKKITITLLTCAGYLLLLMTSACIDTDDFDLINGCPLVVDTNAIGIKQVFFSPYKNQHYATATDTVLFSEFGFNFELEIQEK